MVCVPLNGTSTVGDLACQLDLPVILVVGMRLGCINHALLTEASIRHSGASLLGWVANQLDAEMEEVEANIRAISERIATPCLFRVPFLDEPTAPFVINDGIRHLLCDLS